jgi:hypothetical protein
MASPVMPKQPGNRFASELVGAGCGDAVTMFNVPRDASHHVEGIRVSALNGVSQNERPSSEKRLDDLLHDARASSSRPPTILNESCFQEAGLVSAGSCSKANPSVPQMRNHRDFQQSEGVSVERG